MTGGLFLTGDGLQRIPIEDADIFYAEQITLPAPADDLLLKLITTIPWRAEAVKLWGKKFDQPRLIAWFGEPGRTYTYSGIALRPLPWTEDLLQIKRCVENVAAFDFNSVLLNLYRDERDSIGFHSDDEKELGERPTIASVSLGEERTFVLKHKTEKERKRLKLKLTSGSLLVMKGDTQKNWKHGIEKENQKCGPRVNLTFRAIV